MSTGVIVHGGYCPRGLLSTGVTVHGGYCPRGLLSTGVIVHGGYCPRGLLSTGVIVHGGYCPRGGLLSGGGVIVRGGGGGGGVIVRGYCPEVIVRWVNVLETVSVPVCGCSRVCAWVYVCACVRAHVFVPLCVRARSVFTRSLHRIHQYNVSFHVLVGFLINQIKKIILFNHSYKKKDSLEAMAVYCDFLLFAVLKLSIVPTAS